MWPKTMFIRVHYIMVLSILLDFTNSANCLPFTNVTNDAYGDGYGTKWIYFPDGDGELHFVDLTLSNEYINTRTLINHQIMYRLYTRYNSGDNYILINEMGKPTGPYDLRRILSCKPLKIITHGWMSSADASGIVNIKNAYLESMDVNVLTVDWSSIASSFIYPIVATETKGVGHRVATFLNKLREEYKFCEDKIHLIGHSLGAHVMGIAGSKANFTVERISGLDPAGPLFEYPLLDKAARLDSSDAKFVDVIHTCAGVLGFAAPVGTVDFYPNNGIPPQPACDSIPHVIEACSHGRSYHYFEESIRYSKAFPAVRCKSWTEFLRKYCDHESYMGEGGSTDITGIFYLKTNGSPPYGLRS